VRAHRIADASAGPSTALRTPTAIVVEEPMPPPQRRQPQPPAAQAPAVFDTIAYVPYDAPSPPPLVAVEPSAAPAPKRAPAGRRNRAAMPPLGSKASSSSDSFVTDFDVVGATLGKPAHAREDSTGGYMVVEM
jgi:hypothetical protein